MKKFLLMMTALVCVVCMQAQSYGILVNDTVLFSASYQGKDQATGTFDEYLAHVQLAAGDQFKLCNATNGDTWTVALDEWTVAGFSRNEQAGYYTTTNTGCYDFYIKLKYGNDQLYIGDGANCGEGEA